MLTPRRLSLPLAAAIAAVSMMSNKAHAADFTKEQCAVIFGVGTDVVKHVGKDKLSKEFRQSFVNYVGTNLDCAGPKEILTPANEDIDTFHTIRSLLLMQKKPISLEKAGLRSVDPASATNVRPATATNGKSASNPAPKVN